jgi:hypothetical protein
MLNGKRFAPPLGVPQFHVGRIPRSVDGGVTWQPTIDVDSEVHGVRAPTRTVQEPWWPQPLSGFCASSDGETARRHGWSNRRAFMPLIDPQSPSRPDDVLVGWMNIVRWLGLLAA